MAHAHKEFSQHRLHDGDCGVGLQAKWDDEFAGKLGHRDQLSLLTT